MTYSWQRVFVLALGALIVAGAANLTGAASAFAQAPVTGPNAGYPFNLQFPYVGTVSVTGANYPAGATYPALSESSTLFPYAAYVSSPPPAVISNPISVVGNFAAPELRSVGAQTAGMYCKDKSGGQVWMPAGSPPDSSLSC